MQRILSLSVPLLFHRPVRRARGDGIPPRLERPSHAIAIAIARADNQRAPGLSALREDATLFRNVEHRRETRGYEASMGADELLEASRLRDGAAVPEAQRAVFLDRRDEARNLNRWRALTKVPAERGRRESGRKGEVKV